MEKMLQDVNYRGASPLSFQTGMMASMIFQEVLGMVGESKPDNAPSTGK